MAKKKNVTNPTFKFKIKYRFEENLSLSMAAIVVLIMMGPIFLIAFSISALYYMHISGRIEVRIPKPCRCLCFKNYLSPEEKEEIRRKAQHEEMLKRRKDMTLRIAIKPTVSGFVIDDSFFEETEARPRQLKDKKPSGTELADSKVHL